MTSDQQSGSILHVPARDIPLPASISPEARQQLMMLQMAQASTPPDVFPLLHDKAAWRAKLAAMDETALQRLQVIGEHIKADVEEIDADGVRVYSITPPGVSPDDKAVYFDIHGGALITGGGEFCRLLGIIMANIVG